MMFQSLQKKKADQKDHSVKKQKPSQNTINPVQKRSFSSLRGHSLSMNENPEKELLEPEQGQLIKAPTTNNTRIPTQMKTEFEEKSGFSFHDVRVHYNSEKPAQLQDRVRATTGVVQRILPENPQNAKELIESQITLQNKNDAEITEVIKESNPNDEGAFTTVGFEHEFAKFCDEQDNPLYGQAHIELAKSEQLLNFTGLPFILETDSDNTIELVGAPFIMPTAKETPVPFADDIKMVDVYMQTALKTVCASNSSLNQMKQNFLSNMGLAFQDERIDHIDTINKLIIRFGADAGGIAPQANFATNAFAYDAAKEVTEIKASEYSKEYRDAEGKYKERAFAIAADDITTDIAIFLRELTKNLSLAPAVAYQRKLAEYETLLWKPRSEFKPNMTPEEKKALKEEDNQLREAKKNHKEFGLKSSLVKDTNTFWLKNTIFNFGFGILSTDEWTKVRDICEKMKDDDTFKDCKRELKILIVKIYDLLSRTVSFVAEKPKVKFGGHKPKYLGARQDTYVSLDGKRKAPTFEYETLHLVEVRALGRQISAGDKFHQLEAKLLEKTFVHDNSRFDISYQSKTNMLVIKSTTQNDPFRGARQKITEIPASALKDSISYSEKDGKVEITIQSSPSSEYIVTISSTQVEQFKYFIHRVMAVDSYSSSGGEEKSVNTDLL